MRVVIRTGERTRPIRREPMRTLASSRDLCGPRAMAPVHLRDPLKSGARRQRLAECTGGAWKGTGPRVRELWRQHEWREQRRRSQIGDGEPITDQISARLQLCFDAVERGENLRTPQIGPSGVDLEPNPVGQAEHGKAAPVDESASSAESPGDQRVRVVRVTKQVVENVCTEVVAELLVDEVFEQQGAPAGRRL